MTSRLFTEAFIIFRLDENGEPVEIIPYYTNAATYVAASITICRAMLRNSTVKRAFMSLAKDLDPNLPEKDVAERFIDSILERFPLVFVDSSLKHPDVLACHHRRAWVDDGDIFETRKQGILINGPRVHNMCVAGTRAESSTDRDSHEQQRFRAFLFSFATSLMHELGHVFVTFLGSGKKGTPPPVYAQASDRSEGTKGEAGAYLENKVFGGVVTAMYNPAEGEDQAGIHYLMTEDHAYKIEQETIDEIVKYKFDLPITRLRERYPGSMRTLGRGLPQTHHSSDPMDAPKTQQLLEMHEAKPIRWDIVENLTAKNLNPKTFSEVHKDILMGIPFKPSLLIEDPRQPPAQAT